jgi:PilZ domain
MEVKLNQMASGSDAVRIQEDSKLLIKWTNVDGVSLSEQSQTNDISENGISFFLKTPVWLDTHLIITIGSSELFGRLHTLTGKVVRIQTGHSGRQLVGVRFD